MKTKFTRKIFNICMALVLVIILSDATYFVRAEEEPQPRITGEEVEYFTEEDLEYIESLGSIKVAYSIDEPPVAYKDKDTGEFSGIVRAILDRISEISGIKFEYIALPGGEVTYDYLQSQDVDLIAGVRYNDANLNANGLCLSNPYFSSRQVMVCMEGVDFDDTTSHSIAISAGSATFKDVVQEQYPDSEIVVYDTVEESFDGVCSGEQDFLLINEYAAEYWLAKPEYMDLTVIPVDGLKEEFCFSALIDIDGDGGMSKEDGEKIIAILNKSLSQISEDELNNIIIKVTLENQYSYTFLDFLYIYKYFLIVGVILIIIILVVLVSMMNLKKKHEEHRRAEEKKIILQQKRYKMIIDNSEEMIYEISLSGETCIASEKIKEKFGWDIPRIVDNLSIRTLSDILHVHPDDEEQFYSSTEGLVANKEVKELLIRLGKTNGTYLWCKVIYLPIIDDEHNMVSIVGKIVDVDDSVKEKKRLEFKSRTDSLTGLLNKRTFEEEIRNYIDENTAVSSAFIFVDMDFFKNVNDLLGHVMGDQVIKDTAVKLQVIFANCDLVARFGGDEFCIFVKDIPSDTLVDKLNFAIEKLSDIYTNNGIRVSLTASIGAAYCSSPSVGYDQLLECADKAVYAAKENGKNRYIITYL